MITKNRLIVILAILTAILPFLGLPYFYENIFVSCSGILICVVMFFIVRESRVSHSKSSRTHIHTEIVESGPMYETVTIEDTIADTSPNDQGVIVDESVFDTEEEGIIEEVSEFVSEDESVKS